MNMNNNQMYLYNINVALNFEANGIWQGLQFFFYMKIIKPKYWSADQSMVWLIMSHKPIISCHLVADWDKRINIKRWTPSEGTTSRDGEDMSGNLWFESVVHWSMCAILGLESQTKTRWCKPSGGLHAQHFLPYPAATTVWWVGGGHLRLWWPSLF
jgi:hypothetical protein